MSFGLSSPTSATVLVPGTGWIPVEEPEAVNGHLRDAVLVKQRELLELPFLEFHVRMLVELQTATDSVMPVTRTV